MHRSGTSAVTRMLALHGLALPKRLLEGRSDNPLGFWESQAAQQFDDRVLAELGSAWDDPRPLAWPRLSPARLAALREEAAAILVEEYGAAPLLVMKEPRMARLMPVWRPALAMAGLAPRVVMPVRNPLEVAASLEARNGIGLAEAARLWLGHVLAAERDSRGLPRTVLHYDILLRDWRSAVAPVLGLLPEGLAPEEEAIEAFLSAEFRHHSAYTDSVLLHPDLPGAVKQAYAELRRQPSPDGIDEALMDLVATRFAEGRV
jgi:hypothetical protein